MAEDCLEHAIVLGQLDERPCVTARLPIHGALRAAESLGALAVYGTDASEVQKIANEQPELKRQLHSALPIIGAQVVWAVRREMARTLDDVLARRTRALFLNARATIEMAPQVAKLMATELGRDPDWQQSELRNFSQIARCFLVQTI